MLRYAILGPVEVRAGEARLRVGGPREQKVLATLLLSPDRAVQVPRLVAVLWGDEPPPTAKAQVHNSIAALRRNIVSDDGQRVEIVSSGAGFVLRLGTGRCDAVEFGRLMREADGPIGRGEYPAAAVRLREALDLWRGPALGGLSSGILRAEARRLEEQRLACLERRIEVDLALGRYGDLVAELAGLVAEFPLRERLVELHMLALHRAGRRQDALAVYAEARQRLAAETGLDPRPELERLLARILRGEDVPDPPQEARSPTAAAAVQPPAQVPAGVADFTGRVGSVDRLDRMLAGKAAVVAITGGGGVGKTALAVHWAHRVRDRFPDGQLYLNLHGYSTTAALSALDALGRLLRDLGVPPDRIPADLDRATGMYRTTLAGKRLLVVLDNARRADQVRPLLPAAGCVALVTSRDRLSGLVARDGARRLELDVLAPDDAVTLLTRIVGTRIGAEPAAAVDLARACAYLPLAVRITAARLVDHPHRGVAEHLAELRMHALDALRIDGDDDSSVPAAFDPSYTALEPDAQRLFRLLGLVPGPDFTAAAAAALSAMPPAAAGRLLDRLAGACLVEQHANGRYTFHDLLRDYARTRATDDDEPDTAVGRLLDWYLHTADAAATRLYPHLWRLTAPAPSSAAPPFEDPTTACTFLDAERPNLVAAIRYAAECGPPRVAWLLTDSLAGYFFNRRHSPDCLAAGLAALLAAQRAGDPVGQAVAELTLGQALESVRDHPPAFRHFERALAYSREAGWPAGEISALKRLGLLYNATGQPDPAERHLLRAADRAARAGHLMSEVGCLVNLGTVAMHTGALRQAVRYYRRGLDLVGDPGPTVTAMALTGLGCAWSELGHHDRGIGHLTRAVALHRDTGGRHGESMALRNLAEAHLEAGHAEQSREYAEAALAAAADAADVRNRTTALTILGAIHRSTGDPGTAAARCREALELAVDAPHDHHHTDALIGLAESELALGQPHDARRHAEQALAVSRALGHRVLHGRALTTLAGVRLAVGDRAAAADFGRQAADIQRGTGYRFEEARALELYRSAVDDTGRQQGHR